jgi:hypothetical protein
VICSAQLSGAAGSGYITTTEVASSAVVKRHSGAPAPQQSMPFDSTAQGGCCTPTAKQHVMQLPGARLLGAAGSSSMMLVLVLVLLQQHQL